jgi:hypothetical protein
VGDSDPRLGFDDYPIVSNLIEGSIVYGSSAFPFLFWSRLCPGRAVVIHDVMLAAPVPGPCCWDS